MKFVTAIYQNKEFVGVLDEKEEAVLNLNKAALTVNVQLPESLLEAVQVGEGFIGTVEQVKERIPEEDNSNIYSLKDPELKLLAPIPRPTKNIFCIGKNYVDHALEVGSQDDIPEHPMVFSKTPTTVIGQNDTILRHKEVTDSLDYEGELAVVIGKKGKGISKEEAFDYVFGYTMINDITARDLQSRHKQFLIGKSLDTSCPMGPYFVHKSLIPNPHNLKIETKVNGEVRQSANTKLMIFDIPTLISTLSQGMTLEPGDIIATGTPAGVGKGFKPPRYLKEGDIVEIAIEELGTLRNKVG
jgi:2-keto-4-pentenoate hydratase/2-oxohepta-3-ene-1,7-dioic acid hydratase in catechol pathway